MTVVKNIFSKYFCQCIQIFWWGIRMKLLITDKVGCWSLQTIMVSRAEIKIYQLPSLYLRKQKLQRHTHLCAAHTRSQYSKNKNNHMHSRRHACIFKVIKRGDFKCSYLFGACCRGNRQCDCVGSLEFLSSCGVRPPCVPLPIFPDLTHLRGAEVGRRTGRGGGGRAWK